MAELRGADLTGIVKSPAAQGTQLRGADLSSIVRPTRARESVDGTNLADEFFSGVSQGVDSLQMSLFGVAGLAGRELGIKTLEDFGIRGAERNELEAQDVVGEAPSFSEIDSVGGFFKWTAKSLGEALPSLSLAVAGGGIGGVVGKKVIENQIKKTLQNRIAKTLGKRAGVSQAEASSAANRIMRSDKGREWMESAVMRGRTTQQMTTDAFGRGGLVGGTVASFLPQTGQIDLELRKAGIDSGLTSLLGGIAGAALETLPALRLLDRAFPGVDTRLAKGFVEDFATTTGMSTVLSVGKQAGLEGTTEALQEVIQLAAMAYHDPSFDIMAPQNRARILDSFAAGALVGAVTGGGAELVGKGTQAVRDGADKARESVQKVRDFKPTLPEWNFKSAMREGNKPGETFPEGFDKADNTVYQEIRKRFVTGLAPTIERAVNSVRDGAQKAFDALDQDLGGGMNTESVKLSKVIADAHNKFVSEHAEDFGRLKEYISAKAAALTVKFKNDPSAELAAAASAAREAEMIAEIERMQEDVRIFTDKIKRDAAKRNQDSEAEVDNIDFDDEILEQLGRNDPEPDTTERRTGPSGRRFERTVGPAPDQATKLQGDVVTQQADILDAAPEKFVVGKNQKTGVLTSDGNVTVKGYDSRDQARTKGLPALRRDFPSATDSTFDIREQADGTFVIGLAEIGNAEALQGDRIVTDGVQRANRGANDYKDVRGRVFSFKHGVKNTNTKTDLVTLALAGRDLTQDADTTVEQGLSNILGRMLERGIINPEQIVRAIDQFKKLKSEADPAVQLDLQVPAREFNSEEPAKANMIEFKKEFFERTGIQIPRDVVVLRQVEDGVFTFGIDGAEAKRQLAKKKLSQQNIIDLVAAMAADRRESFVRSETKDPDAFGREEFSTNKAPDGTRTQNRRFVPKAEDNRVEVTGRTQGRVPFVRPDLPDGASNVVPEQTPQGDFGDAGAFPSTNRLNQVELKLTEDTTPNVNDPLGQTDSPLETEATQQKESRRRNKSLREKGAANIDNRDTETKNRARRLANSAVKAKVMIDAANDELGAVAKGIKDIVRYAQNKLGLGNTVVVFDRVGLKAFIESGAVTDPAFLNTLTDPTVQARNIRIGQVSYIFLSDKILSDPTLTAAALAHELGHQVYSATWDQLTEAGQKRLQDAFRAAVPESPDSSDADSFNEWMADQLAAWMLDRKVARTPVEKFFQNVAVKLRELYDFIARNERFQLDETYADFIDAMEARVANANPGVNPIADAKIKAWFKNEGTTGYKFWGNISEQDDLTIPVPAVATDMYKSMLAKFKANYPAVAKRAVTINAWVGNAFKVAIAPSTSTVRSIAKRVPIANQLVRIFARAEMGTAKTNSNYHQRKDLMNGRFRRSFARLAHLDEKQRVALVKSLRTKEGDSNAVYTKDELIVRDLFDDMHTYARERGLPVKNIVGYYPRQFDNALLLANEDKIVSHLTDKFGHTTKGRNRARAFYNSLLDSNANDGQATGDAIETPSFKNMNSRKARDKFFDQFLDNNLDATIDNYIRNVVKRGEFNAALGAPAAPAVNMTANEQIREGLWDPKRRFNDIMSVAKKQGASKQDLIILGQYVDANIGQLGRDSLWASPKARKWMAGVIAYQNMRVLLFTVLASLPDMVGPAIRSNDMKLAFKSMANNMQGLAKDDSDLATMARAFGIISDAANNHIMTEFIDSQYMSNPLKKASDAFFKYTGLNWYTDFTRKAALGVGIDYLVQQAEVVNNPEQAPAGSTDRDVGKLEKKHARAVAALKEFNVTAEDISKWNADGRPVFGDMFQDPNEGRNVKVAEALVQFVDESIMRPNASQRPIMASHPAAMLVFHLKGFMYASNEVIVQRIIHNIDRSEGAKELGAAIAPAVLMMAITAVGLELRELLQYAGSNRKPPTDRMDKMEYTAELFTRAGLAGYAQLGFDFNGAVDRGQSEIAGMAGPTIGQMGDWLSKPATQNVPRAVPVVGQLPAGRAKVRSLMVND